MTRLLLGLACLGLTGLSAWAQDGFIVYGQSVDQRGSTRIGYWKTTANEGLGEVVVNFGRPEWKASYDKQLEELTRGKMWRMGDNFWTTLDTNLPVRIGGVEVPVGYFYLAIRRSREGSDWSLVFIDPEQSRKKWLDAYDVGTRPTEIPVLFSAPLRFRNTTQVVRRMEVLLSLNPDSQTEGTLQLSWGKMELSAPIQITLPGKGSEE